MSGRSRLLVVALVVFALAIGVLIGSGPLRSALLGTTNTDARDLATVEGRAAIAEAKAQQGEDFADATGPIAVRGHLDGIAVALVRTADATDEDAAAAAAHMADAGATTASTVALTEDWASDERAPFRDALAEQIATAMDDPPVGATTAQVLSAALAEALAPGADGDFVDAAAQERADTLWTLLSDAQLVTGERAAPANLFLLVTPGADVSDLAGAFVDTTAGTVVAFTTAEAGPAGAAATVTNAASFYGAWAVAGAAISAANGNVGAFDATDADELIGDLAD